MKRIIFPGEDDARILAWVKNKILSNCTNPKCLGLEQDGELIAGVVYGDYRKEHSIGVSIAAIEGKQWMTREFLYHAFYYPFVICNCIRIDTKVRESNTISLKFSKHIGWVEEGFIRKGFSENEGLIVFGMLKEECRFLKIKNR